MCYIYVNSIQESEQTAMTNDWLSSTNNLILKCVEVLLEDLDEYKVRGLSKANRIAFIKRRSDNPVEKRKFLQYLSLRSIGDSQNVMSSEYISGVARDYFKEYPNSVLYNENKVNGIQNQSRSNNPDFITQLILSGVLVSISTYTDIFYDFPHRRFREALGAEALTEELFDKILSVKLKDRDVSEFVQFVFQQKPHLRNKILDDLYVKLSTGESNQYYNLLIVNLLTENNYFEGGSHLLELKIINWLKMGTAITLSQSLIVNSSFSTRLVEQLNITLKSETSTFNQIYLASALLARLNPELFKEIFSSFNFPKSNSEIALSETHIAICLERFGILTQTETTSIISFLPPEYKSKVSGKWLPLIVFYAEL
jgi:hypothetical protein